MEKLRLSPSLLPAAGSVRPFSMTARRLLCLALMSVAVVSAGLPSPLAAAPDDGVSAPKVHPQRPIKTDPVTDAIPPNGYLTPNDVIGYDAAPAGSTGGDGGAYFNFNVHNTSGTAFGNGSETILANSTNGSGLPFSANNIGGGNFAVSPPSASPLTASNTGKIYYFFRVVSSTVISLAQIDPSTGVRSIVSDGNNTALGPVPQVTYALTWDYATGTILYYDGRTNGNPAAGFYRIDPATGVRARRPAPPP